MFTEDSAIGIIGGADGPTAIIVTGSPVGPVLELLAVVLVLAVIVTAAVLLIRHFRKKKKK